MYLISFTCSFVNPLRMLARKMKHIVLLVISNTIILKEHQFKEYNEGVVTYFLKIILKMLCSRTERHV